MIKFTKFRIFLLLLVSLVVIYYFSNGDFKHIDSKKDLISFLNLNKDRILNFEDKIYSDGLSDSNFYAEHRYRDGGFYFFRMEGDHLGETFHLSPIVYEDFKKSALALNIKNIWKYPDENFYTLAIRGMERFDDRKLFILVLKKNETEFKVPLNSSLYKNDTTSQIENFGSDKSILVLENNIWIKLKQD